MSLPGNLPSIYDPPYILFKEKCPYGCPCDGYDCEISQKKSVLVLYTRENSNQPVLIKADGQLSTQVFIIRVFIKILFRWCDAKFRIRNR